MADASNPVEAAYNRGQSTMTAEKGVGLGSSIFSGNDKRKKMLRRLTYYIGMKKHYTPEREYPVLTNGQRS